MSRNRDYQKSRCYAWENRHVGPVDHSEVAFKDIQAIVDYIWDKEGLKYPPRVVEMNPRKHAMGTGSRTQLEFKIDRTVPTWVIIHEVAHSLTSDLESSIDGHGPVFVGAYMKLLDKHIPGLNLPVLMHTANISKVKFTMIAPSPIKD